MTATQTPDFDRMSDDYERLLRDPLRERFASEQSFFIRQKCRVLLEELARSDAVTGVANRRGLMDHLTTDEKTALAGAEGLTNQCRNEGPQRAIGVG